MDGFPDTKLNCTEPQCKKVNHFNFQLALRALSCWLRNHSILELIAFLHSFINYTWFTRYVVMRTLVCYCIDLERAVRRVVERT